MKVMFWLFVCLISGTIGLGHLGYVHYFAGEPAGDAVLFDEGAPQTFRIDVTEADFPIRLNFEMLGNRSRVGIVFHSRVNLEAAGDAGCESIQFEAGISEDGDISNATVSSGNATVQVGPIRNLAKTSKLIQCSSSGDLILSASVSNEENFEMDRIEAAIRFKSQAVNWTLAGPSLGVLLISFIMLVIALRQRYPHLAT